MAPPPAPTPGPRSAWASSRALITSSAISVLHAPGPPPHRPGHAARQQSHRVSAARCGRDHLAVELPREPVADAGGHRDRRGNRVRPLALYYFGDDDQDRRNVLDRTTTRNVTINGTILHVAQDDLPFGGVGASGMGA